MKMRAKNIELFRSLWLELAVMFVVVILSYVALLLISRGAAISPEGMALTSITGLLFGFFLLSFAIAIIAVLAGIGGMSNARVKTLVLSHIIYSWFGNELNLKTKIQDIRKYYDGEIVEGRDLMTFEL